MLNPVRARKTCLWGMAESPLLEIFKTGLEKKYIVRDSSALSGDEVHSLVFMSTQEIYSKTLYMSCQTLPTTYDLICQVLFICEMKSLLTCQFPTVKSHRRVNAGPFCPVRYIQSSLQWTVLGHFRTDLTKTNRVSLLRENMKETVASFIFPGREQLKIFFKQGADVNVIRMDFHKKQSSVSPAKCQ